VTLRAPFITPSQDAGREENCFADAPAAILDEGVELKAGLVGCAGMDLIASIVIVAPGVDIRVYADAMGAENRRARSHADFRICVARRK